MTTTPETAITARLGFAYLNAAGEVSQREAVVTALGSAYFIGHCSLRNAERTFRFDRVCYPAVDLDTGESFAAPAELRARLRGFRGPPARPSPDNEILFSGFAAARRAELEALAVAAGLLLRATPTVGLDLFVAGPNAGPSKRKKAEAAGARIFDEAEFIAFISEGGEAG